MMCKKIKILVFLKLISIRSDHVKCNKLIFAVPVMFAIENYVLLGVSIYLTLSFRWSRGWHNNVRVPSLTPKCLHATTGSHK